jgi:hypothetical protein
MEGTIVETTTPSVTYRSLSTAKDGDTEIVEVYAYRLKSISGGLEWIQLATDSIVVEIKAPKPPVYYGRTLGECGCTPDKTGWGWRVYVAFNKLTDPDPVSYTIHGEGFNDTWYWGTSFNMTVQPGGYRVYDLGSEIGYMLTGGGGSGCPDDAAMQSYLKTNGLDRFTGAVWTITPNY